VTTATSGTQSARALRVWIDLSNSPHPLLFAPIARALESRGHTVMLTARRHAQTVELARERWAHVEVIGGESPPGRAAKLRTLLDRVKGLRDWSRATRADVALSHNSYAQIAAARWSGVPAVTAMDFERQPANHLGFRMATLVLLPDAVPASAVRLQGARGAKVRRYPGLKESLYIGDFEPDPEILASFGVARDAQHPVVVMRTPPSRATYHRFDNPLVEELLGVIAREDRVRCVVLARYPEQREAIAARDLPNVVLPVDAINSRQLMYEADLVIGAGGTMTREAALLGVPTVSIYAGEQPAVDRWLEQTGALRRITRADQLGTIAPRAAHPRPVEDLRAMASAGTERFVAAVEEAASWRRAAA
jgi:predicted glycosyltransferase